MKSDLPDRPSREGRAKRSRASKPRTDLYRDCRSIDVDRSGGWMPVEELRESSLAALKEGGDVAINLAGVDHLDASALQILLALDSEQKRRGQKLELTNASPNLRQWFDYAGAAEQLFHSGADQQ